MLDRARGGRVAALLWLAAGGIAGCTDAGGVGSGGGTEATAGASESSSGGEASTSALDGTSTGNAGRYHPEGFAEAEVHGLAAKLQTEDCRDCHGADLTGSGMATTCDDCHPSGWRTDCVFCHGGDETELGAPPRDIDGSSVLEELSFRAHTAHVTDGIHAAFDCLQCHAKPTDVLSEGHLFDDTPAVSELDFSVGRSPEAMSAGGQCASLYCHGNGNGQLGAISHTDPAPDCGGCHAYAGSPATAIAAMSGEHPRHLGEGLACSECHHATVDASGSIVQLFLHVNGQAEVVVPQGFTYDSSTNACTGSCHAKLHFNEHW